MQQCAASIVGGQHLHSGALQVGNSAMLSHTAPAFSQMMRAHIAKQRAAGQEALSGNCLTASPSVHWHVAESLT